MLVVGDMVLLDSEAELSALESAVFDPSLLLLSPLAAFEPSLLDPPLL